MQPSSCQGAESWAVHLGVTVFKIDSRINEGIGQVPDEAHHKPQQREKKECAEHHRIVPGKSGLEAEQAKPVQRENDLNEKTDTWIWFDIYFGILCG